MPRYKVKLPWTKSQVAVAAASAALKGAQWYANKVKVGKIPGKYSVGGKRPYFSTRETRSMSNLTPPATAMRNTVAPAVRRSRFTGQYKYNGKYTGKFKRTRAKPVKRKWYAQGAVEKIERGGVVSDSQCAYVGATNTPMRKQLESICRCILKELFKQAGIQIVDWTKNIEIKTGAFMTLNHQFYLDANSSSISTDLLATISSSTTYDAIITSMRSNMQNRYTTLVPSYPVLWKLESGNETSNLAFTPLAQVHADQFKFEVKNYVMMLIQNRTLAQGTEANQHDNITNNPLVGKMYVCSSNGAVPRIRGSAPSQGGFIPDSVTGIFNQPHGIDEKNLIKPPKPWYWRNVVKSSNIRLEPGEIKRHTETFTKSYDLSKFLVKMNAQLISATRQTFMGSTVFFALEKLLDSRDSEAPISIGYEVNTTLKTSYTYKKQVITNPLLLVDTVIVPEVEIP